MSYHARVSKRALVIYNPAARKAPKIHRVRAGIEALRDWDCALLRTERPGHATELARDAVRDSVDAAVACGGDGTVNEVVNGLAGSETALAVVRGGTANVWAKETRLPKRPERALRLLDEGEVRPVDLGNAGERYFLLMAGIGFDAAIVRDLHGPWKRRLGAAAYVLFGLRHTLRHRAVTGELMMNGERQRESLYWLVLGNSRNYGGLVNITDRARADDGLLDLALLRRGGLLRLGWLLPWLLLGRHHRRAEVLYRQVESLELRTPELPVQVDGEYLGETPMHFEVARGALRVIVPRGLHSPLFSRS